MSNLKKYVETNFYKNAYTPSWMFNENVIEEIGSKDWKDNLNCILSCNNRTLKTITAKQLYQEKEKTILKNNFHKLLPRMLDVVNFFKLLRDDKKSINHFVCKMITDWFCAKSPEEILKESFEVDESDLAKFIQFSHPKPSTAIHADILGYFVRSKKFPAMYSHWNNKTPASFVRDLYKEGIEPKGYYRKVKGEYAIQATQDTDFEYAARNLPINTIDRNIPQYLFSKLKSFPLIISLKWADRFPVDKWKIITEILKEKGDLDKTPLENCAYYQIGEKAIECYRKGFGQGTFNDIYLTYSYNFTYSGVFFGENATQIKSESFDYLDKIYYGNKPFKINCKSVSKRVKTIKGKSNLVINFPSRGDIWRNCFKPVVNKIVYLALGQMPPKDLKDNELWISYLDTKAVGLFYKFLKGK